MVWWKAVSNTPTMGVSGISFLQASIPIRFAGLCRGARSLHSSTAASTSRSSTTDWANFSPPCTTLWPTAPISSRLATTPVFGLVRASSTRRIASVWSGMGVTFLSFSPPSRA